MIIVIAGIHNNLRSQTQRRIDSGFIGFDSTRLLQRGADAKSVVGVGRFDSSRRPNAFTNVLRDFDKRIATGVGIPLQNLREPAVFVIKKNSTTLRNLLEWLTEHNARQGTRSITAPMLLIDDEADNASINVARDPAEASRINGQIRKLLSVFERSAYVGYTATPFANIFIDPDTDHEMLGDDLFPRDFIVSLDPPSNYFGARRVFIDEPDRIIRHIDDHEFHLPLKHPKDHPVHGLPDSLADAMRAFVLARAIRIARGQVGEHNSMLVNVSRFTDVQERVRNEVHDLLVRMRRSIAVHGGLAPDAALHDPEIAALHGVFHKEYAASCGLSWKEIYACLHDSIGPIRAVTVNSRSSGTLDYEGNREGLNVIAVGGFSLSRGLTLEGLVVSYFLRNSMMYDTLMQMGRWFGYRPGYDDLCRVWMPEEAEGWYAHVAESIEELRDELRRMEAANATPSEFGLKVRSHPDNLIVTARNKIGSSKPFVVAIGLAEKFIETSVLRRDAETLLANRRAAISMADAMRAAGFAPEAGEELAGGRLVRGAPAQIVMQFLGAFRNHPGSPVTEPDPVRRYILERDTDELRDWDILIAGVGKADGATLADTSLGIEVLCQRRAEGSGSDARTLRIEKSRVSSRGVERFGLTDQEIRDAKEGFSGKNFPDRLYRKFRTRPLFILHMLAIGAKGEDLSGGEPVVAWSISFPPTGRTEDKVEYMVNTTWFRERYEDEAEEEAGGDD